MKFKAVNWAALGCGAMVCLAATSASAGVAVTTTTITGDKSSIAYGESVILTATVTNDDVIACGGDMTIQPVPTPSPVACSGPVTVSPGASTLTCTLTGSSFGAGTHELHARYENGGFCAPSNSAPNFTLTVAGPSAVPTTSEWTLWGLTGMLLLGGGVFVTRRFRATQA